jgi:predicted DNA-binding ribbon-helix-helix protein
MAHGYIRAKRIIVNVKKRSVTLQGHATSITLEEEFWEQLKLIANDRDQSIASLINDIDEERLKANDRGLSSAIRIYILKNLLPKSVK